MQNDFVMLNEVKHLHNTKILRCAQNDNLTYRILRFLIPNL